MTRWFVLSLIALTGCATPSPHFRSVPATRIEVDGSVFDVRVRGNLAEAVRVNPQYAPRFGPIRARAGFAMEQVSGCRVLVVSGDQAMATGTLSCDGRTPVPVASPVAVSYSCLQVSQWLNDAAGGPYVDYDCDSY